MKIPPLPMHFLLCKHNDSLRRTMSHIKPWSDDHHKLQQIEFTPEHVDAETGKLDNMMDVVHMDKK